MLASHLLRDREREREGGFVWQEGLVQTASYICQRIMSTGAISPTVVTVANLRAKVNLLSNLNGTVYKRSHCPPSRQH